MKNFLIIVIILLVVAVSVLGFFYYKVNVNYEQLLEIVKGRNKISDLVVEDQYTDQYNFIKKEELYISYELFKEYIDSDIELSNSGRRVYIPLENLPFELETPEVTEFVSTNLDHINIPLRIINDKKYVNLKLVDKLYGVFYTYNEEKNRLYINKNIESLHNIHVKEMKKLYFLEENFLVKFSTVDKNDTVLKLDMETIDEVQYYKVLTQDGVIGYIDASNIDLATVEVEHEIKYNDVRASYEAPKNISLIWDSINGYNDSKNYSVEVDKKVDIISPTWFNLNVNGIVINSANLSYSQKIHQQEKKVWALFKNNFNPEWTNEMLTNEKYMNKAISQILFYSALYDIDGINIDFENVYLKDKENLVHFVKKLRKYTLQQNLVLSLDAVRPGGSDRYSKVIDRKELGALVDYFILMAYDEHWGSSPKSGSVASLPWVIDGIEQTLEEVPHEKLILGVPLYMRVWQERNNKVTDSKAYALKNIDAFLDAYEYQVQYDKQAQQNYIEFKENGSIYKIWLEDKTSLEKRLELVKTYDLSGVAAWRKGYEESYYWDLIEMYLK